MLLSLTIDIDRKTIEQLIYFRSIYNERRSAAMVNTALCI
jgi:hypothetical protein